MKRSALNLLGRLGLLRPAFRGYERARAFFAGASPPADDGLPVPPARLIVRVAGTPDAAWFLESGRLGAEAIRTALARAGSPVEELRAMLDFGCGCGRVTRRWVGLDGTAVHGSDQSAEAVEWCRRNLPFARFATNRLEPPLAYDGESFDLVYALSVFTHLPEELQLAWASELGRVVKPGGFLLLTVHGERYRDRLTAAERARFDAGQLVVRWEEEAGSNLCSAFHPPSYVKERLAASFEVVEFIPEGATGNPHQDLYLLARP